MRVGDLGQEKEMATDEALHLQRQVKVHFKNTEKRREVVERKEVVSILIRGERAAIRYTIQSHHTTPHLIIPAISVT